MRRGENRQKKILSRLCVTFHLSMFEEEDRKRVVPSKSPMMFLRVSGYRQEQMSESTEISFIFSLYAVEANRTACYAALLKHTCTQTTYH